MAENDSYQIIPPLVGGPDRSRGGKPLTAKFDTKRPQSAGLNRASVSNMNRRYLFWCVAAIFAGLFGLVTFFLATFEDPAVDPTRALRSETEIPEGSVTVRFTGISTLLFFDGETHSMVDGWFSRFGPLELALGQITPDHDAITRGLERNHVGQPDAIHVSHPQGRWLIQGSAGYMEGGLSGYDADVVFLGIGGLGTQTKEYREAYWHETVTAIAATRVIPIHRDSLTGPTEGPFTGPIRVAALLTNAGTPLTLEFLEQQESNHPELQFSTLPRFDEIVLF